MPHEIISIQLIPTPQLKSQQYLWHQVFKRVTVTKTVGGLSKFLCLHTAVGAVVNHILDNDHFNIMKD